MEDAEGVDTLLLHLLADLRAGAEIEVPGAHSATCTAAASRHQIDCLYTLLVGVHI